ncbi:MAG: hypothetical protein ACT4QC_08480 [Planctomycetaceae bacterium]
MADDGRIVMSRNPLGQAGFIASLLGVCGIAIVGPFGEAATLVGVSIAFLTLPGIVLSAMGLRRNPRRLAAWGLLMGIGGAMYLPTFGLALFRWL